MSRVQTHVIADNSREVTRWTFAAAGLHHHDLDHIVVPVTDGTFTITDTDGGGPKQ